MGHRPGAQAQGWRLCVQSVEVLCACSGLRADDRVARFLWEGSLLGLEGPGFSETVHLQHTWECRTGLATKIVRGKAGL